MNGRSPTQAISNISKQTKNNSFNIWTTWTDGYNYKSLCVSVCVCVCCVCRVQHTHKILKSSFYKFSNLAHIRLGCTIYWAQPFFVSSLNFNFFFVRWYSLLCATSTIKKLKFKYNHRLCIPNATRTLS